MLPMKEEKKVFSSFLCIYCTCSNCASGFKKKKKESKAKLFQVWLYINTIEIYHLWCVSFSSLCRLPYWTTRRHVMIVQALYFYRSSNFIDWSAGLCVWMRGNHPRIHLKNKKDFFYIFQKSLCSSDEQYILKKEHHLKRIVFTRKW